MSPLSPLSPLSHLSPTLERLQVHLGILAFLRLVISKDVAVILHRGATSGNGASALGREDDRRRHEAGLDERRRLLAVVNQGADHEAMLGCGAVVGQDDLANCNARLAAAVPADAAVFHPPGVADEERAVAEHLLDAVELGCILGAQLDLLHGLLDGLAAAPLRANGSLRWALVLGRHFVRAFAGVCSSKRW